jgi:hypothetical protein
MSKQRTKKATDENARVKVGKLSPQDKEVKNGEATKIKGGGGMPGGVLGDRSDGIGQKLGR